MSFGACIKRVNSAVPYLITDRSEMHTPDIEAENVSTQMIRCQKDELVYWRRGSGMAKNTSAVSQL